MYFRFFITLEELYDGEDIGTCPSCTLRIRVIFDEDSLPALKDVNDEGAKETETEVVSNVEKHDSAAAETLSQLTLDDNTVSVEA